MKSTKSQLPLRNIALLVCLVLITYTKTFGYNTPNSNSQTSSTAKATTGSSSQRKDLQSKGDVHDNELERDFDKIRKFQSYDPATGKWSTIEDFDTVEILEDPTQQRKEHYIYHGFWAYDALAKQWYKVDIRGYGYKLTMPSGQLDAMASSDQVPEEKEKKPTRFWKNLALSLRVGPGTTFYQNKTNTMRLEERDGKLYLQSQEELEKSNDGAYRVRWFEDVAEHEIGFSKGKPTNAKAVALGKEVVFTGQGWDLPITLAMHYTFLKRFRIGGGYGLELNYLKELKPKGEAAEKVNTFTIKDTSRWFYNTRWFGLIAFQVVHKPKYDIIADFQAGKAYNAGIYLKEFFTKGKYVCDGLFFSAGVAYERNLNGYFKFVSRLSGNLKTYKDGPFGNHANGSVNLRQLGLHLEAGLNLNFGRDQEKSNKDIVSHEDTLQNDLEQPKNTFEQTKEEFSKGPKALEKTGEGLKKAKRKRSQLGNALKQSLSK